MIKPACRLNLYLVALAAAFSALLLGLPAAATARALPAPRAVAPRAHVAASRGYKIYNLSGYTLKLLSVDKLPIPDTNPQRFYLIDWEGRPPIGTVLKPGAADDWELKYVFGDTYAAKLLYEIVGDPEGRFQATLKTSTFSNDSTCLITTRLGQCSAEGLRIVVLDPPGTVHDIPADRAQDQASVLRELCDDGSLASCAFAATKEVKTQTPKRGVGQPVANCLEKEADSDYEIEDKVSESNSVEVALKVGGKIGKLVDIAVTTTYGHEWVREHTFKQVLKVPVEAKSIAWVAATAPVFRDTGDFTLKMGNTTWILRNVYFDTPDPSRTGHYTIDGQHLTPQQYKDQCSHNPPPGSNGLRLVPRSYGPKHLRWVGLLTLVAPRFTG